MNIINEGPKHPFRTLKLQNQNYQVTAATSSKKGKVLAAVSSMNCTELSTFQYHWGEKCFLKPQPNLRPKDQLYLLKVTQ
jgi:hypothetical protein